MNRALRLSLLAVLPAALVFAADNKPPAMDEAMGVNLKDAKWAAPKLDIPPGVVGSPIAADPGGANVGYAKFAPGYTFPMHFHSATEYTVLISGKASFTVNGKTYDLEPGGYVVVPAKAHHMAKCAPGAECVLLTRRAGPPDYNWVK
ncbi:MAG TPA: cupin domain-containing protein [Myxococcaceae bacterium]|jgi:quercetin dioxygenase-like cupin family protein